MTVQKKILDLTGSQYLVQKVKSAINDVDSSLSTHIADTDIHVTTADKNKWNNQTYVFRYSSTALTPSSTNSNTLLDNTDNLKVGDKVIDSSGVLFSITAIDTANSTFTVGSALVDLAQDSDVVHKSGDESIIGSKRFGVVQSFTGYPSIRLYSTSDDINVSPSYPQQLDIRFTDKNNNIISYFIFQHRTDINEPFRTCWRQVKMDGTNGYYSINFNNLGVFYPENNNAIDLGGQGNRWKSVYAMNYYYGSNNVEFSTKFVTTDTNQTVSGQKVFTDINAISNSSEIGVSGGNNSFKVLDKNKKTLLRLDGGTYSTGMAYSYWLVNNGSDEFNGVSLYQPSSSLAQLRPYSPTLSLQLGASNRYFSDCYTSKINSLTPSSLSLPDLNNAVDISGYITDLAGLPNVYSPPANGYIVLRSTTANVLGIVENTTGMGSYSRGSNQVLAVNLPVVKNSSISIYAICSSLTHAKFIPCQGNI